MTYNGCFVPVPDVVAEVIEGEAVIINLSTGVYYSMDRAGALVWEALAAGHSARDIAGALTTSAGVAADVVNADMDTLLKALIAEGLVGSDPETAPATTALSFPAAEYAAPTLTSYRDMRDLLALDPPAPGLDSIAWNSNSSDPKK